MLIPISPLKFRKRTGRTRARKGAAPTPPPPVALTLVAASYISTPSQKVRMEFDRAIDAAGLDGAEIVVDVAADSAKYRATGTVTVIDPATIEVGLESMEFFIGEGVHLTASGDTGIVAADDGGTWAGVDFIELPFAS